MSSRNFICSLILIAVYLVYSVNCNTIRLQQGVLIGSTKTARNGNLFNAFYGVPYAQPPIGKLRFQPPQPAEPWSGVWNATDTSPMCIQVKQGLFEVQGQEDCLYLNVFTPLNAKQDDDIPVMVFIHGGSYKTGSNANEGPEYIMGFNIILVQPNYRLGFLGLLSTGDDVVPGNMALKDQTMALEWVKQNIHMFGGDRSRVTLAGHSSGAVSVHLHTFSPLSKGLFNRVIILSSTSFVPRAVSSLESGRQMSEVVAQAAGCECNSSEELLNCLQNRDATNVTLAQRTLTLWQNMFPAVTVNPVVEDKKVRTGFLYEYPTATSRYASTSLQWLIGHTSQEGGYVAASILSMGEDVMEDVNTHYKQLLPVILGYLWSMKAEHVNHVTQAFRTTYFGDEAIDYSTDNELTRLLSDFSYNVPLTDAVKSYNGTKYVYLYDYKSNFSSQLYKYSYSNYLGICHVDDLQLYFKREDSADSLSQQDIAFGDAVLQRWVNFAYSGNPNEPYPIDTNMFSAWSPVTSSRVEYLRLKLNGSMETDLDKRSYEYMKSLPIFSNTQPHTIETTMH